VQDGIETERRITVVVLGGNALAPRGEAATIAVQRDHAAEAAELLVPLLADRRLLVTHGNGPQVGLLAEQAETAGANRMGLDVLGAESEAQIGYVLEQAFEAAAPGVEVATLLTQTIVDVDDRAFGSPTKPIGPVYDAVTAKRLASERGWFVRPDGAYWRRVVPSPEPRGFVEEHAIQVLLAAGVVVICAGGGGVPVVATQRGGWQGVLAAALLARRVGAAELLLLTDVAAVMNGWETSSPEPIRRLTVGEARRRVWAVGSMAPKIEAACRFAETGGVAAIGALGQGFDVLRGMAGTRVVAGDGPIERW
jgi:carbamate kinase